MDKDTNLSLLWMAAPVMASGGAKGIAETRRLDGAAPGAGGAGTISSGGSFSTGPGLEDGGGVTGGGDVEPAVGAGAQLAGGRRCRAGGLACASLGAWASWPNTHCW